MTKSEPIRVDKRLSCWPTFRNGAWFVLLPGLLSCDLAAGGGGNGGGAAGQLYCSMSVGFPETREAWSCRRMRVGAGSPWSP